MQKLLKACSSLTETQFVVPGNRRYRSMSDIGYDPLVGPRELAPASLDQHGSLSRMFTCVPKSFTASASRNFEKMSNSWVRARQTMISSTHRSATVREVGLGDMKGEERRSFDKETRWVADLDGHRI
jgi:hypothetical protein